MQVGQKLRLLLSGSSGAHSVEGVLKRLSPHELEFTRASNGRTLTVPKSAILSVEIATIQGGLEKWRAAALPDRMEILVQPLDGLFRTGAGAVIKNATMHDTDSAL